MKLQPLDLEEIFEKYKWDLNKNERANYIATEIIRVFGVNKVYEHHNENIDKLKNEIKQRLKSACEFWLKYKDNPVLLCREKPEYKKEFEPFATAFKSSSFSSQKLKWILNKYNDWLFHLVFKSILEDDKK